MPNNNIPMSEDCEVCFSYETFYIESVLSITYTINSQVNLIENILKGLEESTVGEDETNLFAASQNIDTNTLLISKFFSLLSNSGIRQYKESTINLETTHILSGYFHDEAVSKIIDLENELSTLLKDIKKLHVTFQRDCLVQKNVT